MADSAGLEVTTADDGETVINDASTVTVAGEIDFATSPQLKQALVDVLHTKGPDTVVDLSAVSFVDASGIGVLVGAANLATSGGGRLILRHPSPAVLFLLDHLELDGVLAVER
jgi:anti-sigma B factor antagonist